jgi:hypothetical protein
MKKFKNIKLMLIGLLAMVGMNAFAQTDNYVYEQDKGIVYKVVEPGKVNFVGLSAKLVAGTDFEWSGDNAYELVIGKTITANAPGTGAATQYTVVGFESNWAIAKDAGKDWETQKILDDLEKIKLEMTVRDANKADAWFALTNATGFEKLRSFIMTDCRMTAELPAIAASHKDVLETLDVSGVSNDGDPITIPANWAYNFSKLTSVKLPNKGEELIIGEKAFAQTKITADVLKGTNVTTIGDKAFQGCPMTEVTIPESVTSIGNGAFWSLTATKKIFFNASVETITGVFSDLAAVTDITITSESVKKIAKNAFIDATGLKNLTIDAANLKDIEAGAFAAAPFQKIDLEDTGLTTVANIPLTHANIKKTDGTGLNTFLFPKTLTTLPTFNGFAALATINDIPAGVTSIPTNAFLGTKIKNIKFAADSKLTEIAANAFKGNTTLETMDLTNAVDLWKIGDSAFEGCTGLTTITIGGTKLREVGNRAFFNCQKLGAFDMSASNSNAGNYSIGTSAFEMVEKTSGKKDYQTALTSVKLPNVSALKTGAGAAITLTISGRAFYGCAKLTNFEEIGLNQLTASFVNGGRQFEDAGLTGVVDLSGAKGTYGTPATYYFTAVPNYAFANNQKITEVKLPEGTTAIGVSAFEDCATLATVNFADLQNLATLSTSCFEGCDLKKKLDLSKNNKWDADSKSYVLTKIGDRAFAYNKNMEEVILPNQISSIGAQAFAANVKLSKINLNQTNITKLPNLFTEDYNSDEVSLDALTSITLDKDAEITIKEAGTGEDVPLAPLVTICEFAFQFTGLTGITIPESVEYFGVDNDGLNYYGTSATDDEYRVFQGCTELTTFTWKNAQQNILGDNTFRGDNNLEEVHFLTIETIGELGDENIFFMCDKEKCKVFVTSDSYNQLKANGFDNDSRKYSTLMVEGNVQFAFKAAGLANDEYYYSTYCNWNNASWFKANTEDGDGMDFDVYAAVIQGAKVVLKKAIADNGYYKVAQFDGSNRAQALCVVRSKNIKAVPELKSSIGSLAQSTLAADNMLQYCYFDGYAGGSKLKYVFKLGNNKGNVAFYRFKSGDFKEGTIYIEDEAAARFDAMEIVIEDNTTGIKAINENVENDNAPIYNLQGVRVNSVQKGMYIKNGKKFMK